MIVMNRCQLDSVKRVVEHSGTPGMLGVLEPAYRILEQSRLVCLHDASLAEALMVLCEGHAVEGTLAALLAKDYRVTHPA